MLRVVLKLHHVKMGVSAAHQMRLRAAAHLAHVLYCLNGPFAAHRAPFFVCEIGPYYMWSAFREPNGEACPVFGNYCGGPVAKLAHSTWPVFPPDICSRTT